MTDAWADARKHLEAFQRRCDDLPKLSKEIVQFKKDYELWKKNVLGLAMTKNFSTALNAELRKVQNAVNSFAEWEDPTRPRNEGNYLLQRDIVGEALQGKLDVLAEFMERRQPSRSSELRFTVGTSLTLPIEADRDVG
ncbi:hypothetical protein [Streptosporangium sp. NPDC049078]|uniref:hypothetical protein n=1 Tax=Streptosporangium sp. NPDC049078 TaxID=3155767 RepID=UPI00341A10F0